MADAEMIEAQLAALESRLDGAVPLTAAFEAELARLGETMLFTGREVTSLSSSIGGGLRRAFDGVVFDGMRLQDALRGVAQSVAASAYSVAMKPVQNAVGGAIASGLSGLLGGAVTPFAKGGVVASATQFQMRTGMGLMGEAGPEAIMPLSRGPDGRLGVTAGAVRPVTVVMNIQTPDVAGIQRSQSQIAAAAQRMLAQGSKNR